MPGLGVIGGHSILGSDYSHADAAVVLQRHGTQYTPAHLLDHEANLRQLLARGCDRCLALSSVGGLRDEFGVGTFVAPDDFISLHTSISIFTDARGHTVPSLKSPWRDEVIDTWQEHAAGIAPLRVSGVYWQNFGPRFETEAEIRFIAHFADVVGMTMASEAIVAAELALPYACICVVDNLANGVGERPLTVEEFEAGKRANRAAVVRALDAVIPALGSARA
jgi:5'-methylthioinosine phosphorylase